MFSASAQGHTQSVRSPLQRLLAILAGFVLLGLVAYALAIGARIQRQATTDETHPADVIVVFGAAQYAGKPSPAYRARLDHAADLFARGAAPMLITTGGAGGDPRHSEGQVGRDYLIARGIPAQRMRTVSYGKERPVAVCNDISCWSQNRRSVTVLGATS